MQAIPLYSIEQFSHNRLGNQFYCNTLACHLNSFGYITKPHKHNFYCTILITYGTGTNVIDFQSFPVLPGSVFLLYPGQIHSWVLSSDTDGYILFHTKEFYNLNFTYERIERFLFFIVGSSPFIILEKAVCEKIDFFFRDILIEYMSEQIMRSQKICSLLNILYIELSHLYLNDKPQRIFNENQHTKIHKLEGLIEENYKVIKFPKQYADMMNMSQKHLNRIVKLNLNKTTSSLISDRVVLEAKRMLIYSAYSVSEIAFDLGYPENAYFFRIFKKKSGETPTEYMNKFRNLRA
jgi:AraC-like DNA-binding protein